MIEIAVLNASTKITDEAVQAMLAALNTQANQDVAPTWGTETADLIFVPKGQTPDPSAWQLVFLDNSDQAGALAYHDLTNTGLPISKIFCESILKDSASISVGASHELCEMLVDPWLNKCFQAANGLFWAGEICDPVEDDKYGYEIDGTLVSDLITPGWFGPEYAKAPYDLHFHVTKPFKVLSGGYAQKYQGGGWVQITGADASRTARAEAVPGSRRERRKRGWANWKNSAVDFTRT